MKLAVCLLAAPVAGLVAPAAPARTATVLNAEMSKALPFLTAPKGLKGYIGEEAGFDPVGFAEIMDIKWMREAEIKHGRVAMLATIGYTYPEMPWFAQAFPGDAYAHSNPIKAALAVPPEAWAQVKGSRASRWMRCCCSRPGRASGRSSSGRARVPGASRGSGC